MELLFQVLGTASFGVWAFTVGGGQPSRINWAGCGTFFWALSLIAPKLFSIF